MPVPGWLRDYWEGPLRSALDRWEQEHAPEAQLQTLFERMLAEWPEIRQRTFSDYTIGTYVTHTREWLRGLAATEEFSYVDSESRQRQHIALKYFNLPRETWAELTRRSLETLEQRNQSLLILTAPKEIIAKAQELLTHNEWSAIAAGLLVLGGFRVGEVLLSGEVTLKTPYTVEFRGRLKLRGKPDYEFEKPTLCEASLLLAGWERLRTHPVLLAMQLPIGEPTKANLDAINGKLYPKVRQAVDHFFADLVPSPGEDDEESDEGEQLFSHLMRSLYATLAIWLYCPMRTNPDSYRATILGHRYYFRTKGEERLNYMAQHFYHRFVIAPGGREDVRRGIALRNPGVCVLEVFAKKEKEMPEETRQNTKKVRRKKRPERNSASGFTLIKPRNESGKRYDRIAELNDLAWLEDDATFVLLLDTYDAHQLCQQEPGRAIVASQLTLEQLNLPGDLVAQVRQAMQGGSFGDFLQDALERESKIRNGLARKKKEREETPQQDFSQVHTSDLLKTRRAPEAIERIRRAIATLIEYNRRTGDPQQRWFISQTLLRRWTGAHPRFIKPVFMANEALIKTHNDHFGLTEAHNHTPFPKEKGIKESGLRIAETVAEIPVLDEIQIPSLSAISAAEKEEGEESGEEVATVSS